MNIIDLRLVGNDSNKEEQEEGRSLVFLVRDLQLFAVWEDRHKDRAGSLVLKGMGVGVGVVGGSIQVLAVMDVNEVWSYIMLVWTRMLDKEGMWMDGVEEATRRRMYLAGGPGAQQGPSEGRPAPRDNPNTSGVLVHRDGERVPEPQQPETLEGPEEIPLIYDSLVLDGDERPRNGKGIGDGGEGGASGGQRRK
ncbi:hypothetical protein K435DRAFT_861892 [Dendrothele bispora CBS 962.96]|uniref:Uncharacterized protein n=1 Tax=Dendrothele bispora (strain CBS 962.96) TaxID=1314807 RepID=A0A4S8LU06_DENBC|nr:hypothetical protein K435DRAFT_861892 [Dendrothele bispora CBS 962.96]